MADDDELLPAMVDYVWPDGECPQLTLIEGREAPDQWGRWWPIKGRRVWVRQDLIDDYLEALDARLDDRNAWMLMQFRISQLKVDGTEDRDWRPTWWTGSLKPDDQWPRRNPRLLLDRYDALTGRTLDAIVAEVLRETEAELGHVADADLRALIGCPTETAT
jgi:hypothetical protein